MNNFILILIESLLGYIFLIFLYKKYKIDGILIFGILSSVISMLLIDKPIDILNVPVPLGLGITTAMIIGGNIITQRSGPKETESYLILNIITMILSSIIFYITGIMHSSSINYYSNISYTNIFTKSIILDIALILSMILSIYLTTKLYYSLKKIKNKIIYSNILSIIIVDLLENVIFIGIAYLNQYKITDLILCIIIRYLIKIGIGIFGTIPIYIVDKYN